MKDIIKTLYDRFDREFMKKHTEELAAIERKQTFPAYNAAAKYTYDLLKSLDFDTEIIAFPADGKTAYQDKCTPIAWDASVGRMTVLSSPDQFEDPVLADFEKEPFALIKHSTSTKQGGVVTRLITQAQALAGEETRGAMVLCETDVRPDYDIMITLLDLGALGLVNDSLTGWELTPDCTAWINSGTENGNWHCHAGERDFVNFAVTPRVGRKLRAAANRGDVIVRVESDGHRYEGEIDVVTALIPGKSPKEVWVLAHLYEPLEDDNSTGVMCGIWAALELKRLVKEGILQEPEFSLRLVYAAEMYGYAAYADHIGGNIRDQVIAGINIDGMPCSVHPAELGMLLSPFSSVPNFTNMIMRETIREYESVFDNPKFTDYETSFGNDMFLSDRTNGLPTVNPLQKCKINIHHNSIQTKDILDMETFARTSSMCVAYLLKTLTADKAAIREILPFATKEAQKYLESVINNPSRAGTDDNDRMGYFLKAICEELADFRRAADIPEIEDAIRAIKIPDKKNGSAVALKTNEANKTNITIKESATEATTINATTAITATTVTVQEQNPWLSYAEKIIPSRAVIGFPYDLVNLPFEERGYLPYNMIYGPFANMMSLMDGKRSFADIIREVEWEVNRIFTEKEIRKLVTTVIKLKRGGYLDIDVTDPVTKNDITNTLRSLGIEKGEILLIHSSATGLGYVEGGVDAIIDGIIDAVGNEGTILAPALTNPYVSFQGKLNKLLTFRPFSPDNIQSIITGLVPKTLINRPGAIRSAHSTHSWVALGADARALTENHELLAAPASEESPMAKALAKKGKVAFIGCDVNSNTFLHFLEDQADVPYLSDAIVKIEDSDGNHHIKTITRSFLEHRDFYRSDAENAKFYRRAVENGLEIKTQKIGAGSIKLMDLTSLYNIGLPLIKKDNRLLLCDNSECLFCSSFS